MDRWPLTRPPFPLIGAHRGASAVARENTAAAFGAALAAAADFIETDLRLTADGVAIAWHDADFARLCGDRRAVSALTLAEAHSLAPALLTIDEALDIVLPGALLLLDVKLSATRGLSRVADMLERYPGRGRVALGLRSLTAAKALSARLPDWPRLGLFANAADYAAFAQTGGRWARLWQHDASTDAIGRLHALGLNALVMAGSPTPEGAGLISAPELAAVLDAGADGVMLNDPALGASARAALTQARAAG